MSKPTDTFLRHLRAFHLPLPSKNRKADMSKFQILEIEIVRFLFDRPTPQPYNLMCSGRPLVFARLFLTSRRLDEAVDNTLSSDSLRRIAGTGL